MGNALHDKELTYRNTYELLMGTHEGCLCTPHSGSLPIFLSARGIMQKCDMRVKFVFLGFLSHISNFPGGALGEPPHECVT